MKLLIVAATQTEIGSLISDFGLKQGTAAFQGHELNILITGVGMVATAYALGKHLAITEYDFAVNAGIAGSFDPSIVIGEVVQVNEDHFAELGAENKHGFLTIDELGFGNSCIKPLNATGLQLSGEKLSIAKQVRSITVNTVHGNTNSIGTIVKRLDPQIETMEGAAFFYACNQANLACIQLRAISNLVEERNADNWNIDLAIRNLHLYLTDLIHHL